MNAASLVGKGIAWTSLGNILGKVVIVFNIFLILGHLSVYEYGLSELVLSVVSTLGILLLPGLSSAIIADLSIERSQGRKGKMKTILFQFYLLNALLGCIAWAILFFGSQFAAGLAGNPSIGQLLQIVSFMFLLSPLRLVTTTLAAVELRFIDQSLYGVCEELAKAAWLVLFFVALDKTIDGLLFAIVLSQATAIVVFVPRTISAYAALGNDKAKDMLRFWRILGAHRKWGVASSYATNLVQSLQLWVIKLLLGTEAVGLYAFASGIVSQVASLLPLGTVLATLAPAYASRRAELVRLVRASLKLQIVLSVGLAGSALLTLPIFALAFPDYQTAVPLASVLLLTVVFSGIATVLTPVFAAVKAQKALMASVLAKAGLTAILFPISIFLFGFWGIAVASSLAFLLSIIERYIRLRRLVPELTLGGAGFFTLSPEERAYVRLLLEKLGIFRVLRRYFPQSP